MYLRVIKKFYLYKSVGRMGCSYRRKERMKEGKKGERKKMS